LKIAVKMEVAVTSVRLIAECLWVQVKCYFKLRTDIDFVWHGSIIGRALD